LMLIDAYWWLFSRHYYWYIYWYYYWYWYYADAIDIVIAITPLLIAMTRHYLLPLLIIDIDAISMPAITLITLRHYYAIIYAISLMTLMIIYFIFIILLTLLLHWHYFIIDAIDYCHYITLLIRHIDYYYYSIDAIITPLLMTLRRWCH
jgi:hypothetical protein